MGTGALRIWIRFFYVAPLRCAATGRFSQVPATVMLQLHAFENKTAACVGSGSAEVQKSFEKMYFDYHCIPKVIHTETMVSDISFQFLLPFWPRFELSFSGVTPSEAVLCTSKYVRGGCVCLWYYFRLYLASGAQWGGKHALQHAQMTTVCEEKSSPIFWIVVF